MASALLDFGLFELVDEGFQFVEIGLHLDRLFVGRLVLGGFFRSRQLRRRRRRQRRGFLLFDAVSGFVILTVILLFWERSLLDDVSGAPPRLVLSISFVSRVVASARFASSGRRWRRALSPVRVVSVAGIPVTVLVAPLGSFVGYFDSPSLFGTGAAFAVAVVFFGTA